MEKLFTILKQPGYTHVISTLTLILIVLSVRALLMKKVRKTDWRTEDKRKWYVTIRNWSTLTLVFGGLGIWGTEIQTFAYSIIAITGALIITGKELILCFHGGLLRAFNSMYKVGDRIEIDGIRGDVIDTNLMITKILEIGPSNFTHQFTGRSITIPNSLLLSKVLINESFMHKYVLHVFKVTFKREENWKEAESCMMEAARKECANFMEKAQENMEKLALREGIEVPSVEPRITYKFSSASDLEMIIRVPAPASRKGNIEQHILKRFMAMYLVDKSEKNKHS
ncbi:MAG: mechanosensitive ion channel family protein [Bacteriovoracaceae bacterium]|nr:mechanosensitive ion channel family protein [Bacteriovoracaceae bacterium]